ncbi:MULTISPECIES: hypothetical protein [Vibrio]|uniref:hypothetical protein n=1 Tax=Vibrio TaxID=662 RepID=UPI001CDD6F8C|nr:MULTISPECIES: hypothetical protein [Vibrio]MCA2441635.1 hypothetical protein [Vibrio alginolyticus]MDW1731997.1 hypothetical protein [Vibrio sp. Vb2356]MDW1934195.1 hypothetical protein [Vibrio sp. 970]
MEPHILTTVSSILEVGGLAVFFNYVIKGLKSKIDSLSETIQVQKGTIEAMESRVSEVQKIGETYTKFAKELPSYVEDYEKLVRVTKDRVIDHLEKEVKFYKSKADGFLEEPESLSSGKIKKFKDSIDN